MMKRKQFRNLAAVLVLTVLLLCGCSADSSTASADPAEGAEEMNMAADTDYGVNGGTTASSVRTDDGAKRIYTASLEMETTGFDDAAAGLTELVEACGGYVSASNVDTYGSGYRYGNYTVRIPADQFQSFLNQAGELCHVLRQSAACDDVSEVYYDVQGRLTTQKTKLERLQVLLSRAEKMEDIIALESAISETEQEIEELSGTLQHYDALVEDATVEISLSEVYRLSNTEEPAVGFGSRMVTALSSGWKNFIGGIQGLLVALAYGWVWLLLLAAAVWLVTLWVRRLRRQKREQLAARMRPNPATEQMRSEE